MIIFHQKKEDSKWFKNILYISYNKQKVTGLQYITNGYITLQQKLSKYRFNIN